MCNQAVSYDKYATLSENVFLSLLLTFFAAASWVKIVVGRKDQEIFNFPTDIYKFPTAKFCKPIKSIQDFEYSYCIPYVENIITNFLSQYVILMSA